MALVLTGAGLLVVGSVLPWAKGTVPFAESVSIEGTEGSGKLTFVLGLAVALSFLGHVAWRVIGLVAAVVAMGVALYDISNVGDAVNELAQSRASASVGTGLWLVLMGSLVCVLGVVARSGWIDRWGTRRYYASGAFCGVVLVAGVVLSATGRSGTEGVGLGVPFAAPDEVGQVGLGDVAGLEDGTFLGSMTPFEREDWIAGLVGMSPSEVSDYVGAPAERCDDDRGFGNACLFQTEFGTFLEVSFNEADEYGVSWDAPEGAMEQVSELDADGNVVG